MSVAMAAQPQQHFATATPTGRLRHEGLGHGDRSYALWTHLSPLAAVFVLGPFAVFAPLVMWLARRERSLFVDDHGREVVNFSISFMVLHFVLGLTGIGVIFYPVLWVVGLVSIIRGAVAANRSEYFRYPLTIRFVS